MEDDKVITLYVDTHGSKIVAGYCAAWGTFVAAATYVLVKKISAKSLRNAADMLNENFTFSEK